MNMEISDFITVIQPFGQICGFRFSVSIELETEGASDRADLATINL